MLPLRHFTRHCLQVASWLDCRQAFLGPASGRFTHAALYRLWLMECQGHLIIGHGRSPPCTLRDNHFQFSLNFLLCADER